MSLIIVKPKDVVCKKRATIAAEKKYDSIISEKREEYSRGRNVKVMQEIIRLSREKANFYNKAYRHYMDNYTHAEDSLSDKMPEKFKKDSGFKAFTNYIIDQLSKI
jgi:hypothetical protein